MLRKLKNFVTLSLLTWACIISIQGWANLVRDTRRFVLQKKNAS